MSEPERKMIDAQTSLADEYKSRGPEDPDQAKLDQPVLYKGVVYLPAHSVDGITLGDKGQQFGRIAILARIGHSGIAIPFSAVTAREFGEQLILMADLTDQNAKSLAAAAIAKAQGRGGEGQ